MRIPCQSNPTRDICTFCTCEHLISITKNRNTNKILCGSGNWTLLKQSFDILFSCLDFLYIGIFERGKDTENCFKLLQIRTYSELRSKTTVMFRPRVPAAASPP